MLVLTYLWVLRMKMLINTWNGGICIREKGVAKVFVALVTSPTNQDCFGN